MSNFVKVVPKTEAPKEPVKQPPLPEDPTKPEAAHAKLTSPRKDTPTAAAVVKALPPQSIATKPSVVDAIFDAMEIDSPDLGKEPSVFGLESGELPDIPTMPKLNMMESGEILGKASSLKVIEEVDIPDALTDVKDALKPLKKAGQAVSKDAGGVRTPRSGGHRK